MNNLSTHLRDRVVIFIGGNYKIISQAQEKAIFSEEANQSGSIKIDGDFINLSSIARIVSLEEFYSQNPSKRPAPKLDLFTGQKNFDWKEERRVEVIESMIRGIKKYIQSDRYQGTDGPIKLQQRMEERLLELKLSQI